LAAPAVPGKTLLSLFPEQSVRRRVGAGKASPPCHQQQLSKELHLEIKL